MVPRRCGTNVLGLWDCGGALLGSVEEQRSLHFQSTVGSEATDPFLCGANAVSMLQVRPGAASFAMLEVLSAVAYTRAVQGGGLLGRFARARAPMNDCLA